MIEVGKVGSAVPLPHHCQRVVIRLETPAPASRPPAPSCTPAPQSADGKDSTPLAGGGEGWEGRMGDGVGGMEEGAEGRMGDGNI